MEKSPVAPATSVNCPSPFKNVLADFVPLPSLVVVTIPETISLASIVETFGPFTRILVEEIEVPATTDGVSAVVERVPSF